MIRLVFIILFLLAACTATPKPTWAPNERATAASDFDKDSYECERDKRSTNFRESYETRHFINEAIWKSRAEKFYERCMEVRGWKLVPVAKKN